MSKKVKNIRLLFISITSLYIFLYMEFSQRINNVITLLTESNSGSVFGIYIFIIIIKFLMLCFALLSMALYIKTIFKRDESS
ncbi:hypothetical protein [Polaribacter marinivivus]|jgi:uncharacterized membrane protein|uniref:hypothetical protein n=1 Tax=Polaribacter TaxID=52959 RepID=UPI003D33982E